MDNRALLCLSIVINHEICVCVSVCMGGRSTGMTTSMATAPESLTSSSSLTTKTTHSVWHQSPVNHCTCMSLPDTRHGLVLKPLRCHRRLTSANALRIHRPPCFHCLINSQCKPFHEYYASIVLLFWHVTYFRFDLKPCSIYWLIYFRYHIYIYVFISVCTTVNRE